MSVGAQFTELAVFCSSAVERVAFQPAIVEQYSNRGHLADVYFQLFIYLITDMQVLIADNDERRPSLPKEFFDHDNTCSAELSGLGS